MSRSSCIILILLIILCHAPPAASSPDEAAAGAPWARAAALQREQRWVEAHRLLAEALAGGGLTAGVEARVRLELAAFYETLVDHPAEALRQLGAVARLGLPPGDPLARRAGEERVRIAAGEQRWREQNEIVEQSRSLPWEEERAPAQAAALRRLFEEQPDYPHLASARYHLAVQLMILGRPGEARDELLRARQLCPALDFNLPVGQKLEEAETAWRRSIVSFWSRSVLALLLLLGTMLFLQARPWQRLGLRDLGRLLLVGLAAAAGLLLAAHLLAPTVPPPPAGSFPAPVFSFAHPDRLGAEVLGPFFALGFAGIGGSLLFAVGLAPLPRRREAALLGGYCSLLFFTALMALFWVEWLEPAGWFVPRDGSPLPQLGGHAYLQLEDVEPYVLTEPQRFPGVSTDGFDEPVLIEWIEQHVPGAGEATPAAPVVGAGR